MEPQQREGREPGQESVLPMIRRAKFNNGGWVTFARLGGQIAGEISPNLERILGEAGASASQRKGITQAYQSRANEGAWEAMQRVLGSEQLPKIGQRKTLDHLAKHPLVFALEKRTAARYPDARGRLDEMVKQINRHFAEGGVRRAFTLQSIRIYDKEQETGCRQCAGSFSFIEVNQAFWKRESVVLKLSQAESTASAGGIRHGR